MENSTDKIDVAPCGLDCNACCACSHGVAANAAKTLLESLEKQDSGFLKDIVLDGAGKPRKRKKEIAVFLNYLKQLAEVDCKGCRGNANPKYCMPDCFVRTCAARNNKRYCSECDAFPCSEMKRYENDPLYDQWHDFNSLRRQSETQQY